LADTSEEARARAEAKFTQAQKVTREGKEARADHNTEARAVHAKTEWLRALRLGKEAADKEGKADVKKKPSR
jgi:hypothetical protein